MISIKKKKKKKKKLWNQINATVFHIKDADISSFTPQVKESNQIRLKSWYGNGAGDFRIFFGTINFMFTHREREIQRETVDLLQT